MTTLISDRGYRQCVEQDASHPLRHPFAATGAAPEIDETFTFLLETHEVV